MSKEPSHSFFSKIINLFSSKKEDDKTSNTTEPSDEKIEELIETTQTLKL